MKQRPSVWAYESARSGRSRCRVCARTIGLQLDKKQQCSDWARRPLEQEQFVYAALDAHILLQVYEALLARE